MDTMYKDKRKNTAVNYYPFNNNKLCFYLFLLIITLIAAVFLTNSPIKSINIWEYQQQNEKDNQDSSDVQDSTSGSEDPDLQKLAMQTPSLYNSSSYLKDREASLLLELEEEEWWEVEQSSDHIFNQFRTSSIYLRFADLDENGLHSCYEYKVVDNQLLDKTTHYGTFCYPAIIVTGARKCSTSAMFNLLTKYPGAISSGFKENCIYFPMGDRSIIQYFDSMPRNVEVGEVIVDGCVDLEGNMKIRKMLRQPNTFYVVLVRNFADWIWSAYNFWCQSPYDKECSPVDHWVNPEIHIRSPQLFHEIVEGSINGTFVASPLLIKKPCMKANSMFRTYINTLWSNVPVENTLILSSEDLDNNPELVWNRISQSVGLSEEHPSMAEFNTVRYNTQADLTSRGESKTVLTKTYKPGRYAVSKFQPLDDSTRSILDRCWKDDCVYSSLITGHRYRCAGVSESDSVTIQNLRYMKDFSGDDGAKKIMMIRKYLSRHGIDARYPAPGSKNNTTTTPSASKTAFVDEKSRECKLRFEKNDMESKSSSLSLSMTLPLPLSVALEEKDTNGRLESQSGEKKDDNSELLSALMMQLEHSNEALRLFMMENKRLKTLLAARQTPAAAAATAADARHRRLSSNSEYVFVPNGVLLLALSADDRKYVLNLIHYASRFHAFIDTQMITPSTNGSSSNLSNTTTIGNNIGSSPNIDYADAATAALKVLCNPDPNERTYPVIVGTHPQNIAELPLNVSRSLTKQWKGKSKLFYLLDNGMLACGHGNSNSKGNKKGVSNIVRNYVFSKVVVVLRDSVTSIWTKYQQDNGYPDGIFGDAITLFDWARWEENAIVMLKNMSRPDLQGSSNLWSNRQSQMIDSMAAKFKQVVRLEDLMFSQAKLRLLYSMLDFIKPIGVSAASSGGGPSTSSFAVSRETLKCSHLLANFRNSKKRAYLTGRANIDLAYASEQLICKIKQFYSKSPLQQSALILPQNSSCQGGSSMSQGQFRKCRLRYERRIYLSVVKQHPVALLAVPGPMAVSVRLLVEHSTSVLSGSMETNRYIKELFPGEDFCGQRQSIISAHPKDVTIKMLRSKRGVISLTNQGTKKCRKGMVRGFARGVLLTRDPFLSIWIEANKNLESSLDLRKDDFDYDVRKNEIQDKKSMLSNLLYNATLTYSKSDLLSYDALDKLNEVMTESNAIIVSYESLINPNRALENTPFSKYAALKTLLSFSNYPDIYEEKIKCAYYFVETGVDTKQLEEMNKFFLSNVKLICRINAVFKKVFRPNKFNFTRLYNEVIC